jgi:mannose-6-phosphate isomerase-like protein (cupin superfamily)
MVGLDESGGGFSLVEHPMPPRALAAPLHRHSREDEYSFVVEGRVGAQLGHEIVYGNPGDLIFKPRDQWHTFWNAGDTPARILEIICPAGFERYFEQLIDLAADQGPPTPDQVNAIAERYGLEFQFDSVANLLQEHGLNFGPDAAGPVSPCAGPDGQAQHFGENARPRPQRLPFQP